MRALSLLFFRSMDAKEIIDRLNMRPLPHEGGYFAEVFRSHGVIPARALPDHREKRSFLTSIYYLITHESFSAFHRVKSDEIWLFHSGDLAKMVQIEESGALKKMVLGNFPQGNLQTPVRAGVWQAVKLQTGGSWALFSAVVAPGFEYVDTEIPDRATLQNKFPQHAKIIEELTHA